MVLSRDSGRPKEAIPWSTLARGGSGGGRPDLLIREALHTCVFLACGSLPIPTENYTVDRLGFQTVDDGDMIIVHHSAAVSCSSNVVPFLYTNVAHNLVRVIRVVHIAACLNHKSILPRQND